MKKIKNILTLFLIMSIGVCYGQTTSINFNIYDNQFIPRLKLVGEELMVTTPTGVYSLDLNDMDYNTYKTRDIYAFGGLAVNDFVEKDGVILTATDNAYPAGHLLAVQDGNSFNDYTLYTPANLEALHDGEDATYYNFSVNSLIQHPTEKDVLYLACAERILRSDDFGKTWSNPGENGGAVYVGVSQRPGFAFNPNNPDMLIISSISTMSIVGADSFKYSLDCGSTWSEIEGFLIPGGIAYHPEDKNMVVLAGISVAVTKDGCNTWEFTKELDDSGPVQIAFDVNGGNRLYGRVMSGSATYTLGYSDDLGATWQTICDLPFNGNFVDFVQYKSKIYCLSDKNELAEVDLNKTELTVSEIITSDAVRVSVSGDKINFQSDKLIERAQLVSVNGNVISSLQMYNTEGELSVSDVDKGVYILSFYTADKKTITRKINL